MVQNVSREATRLAERFLQRQAKQAVASLGQVPFGRQIGIGFAVGVTAGAVGTYLYLQPAPRPASAVPTVKHAAAKYGLPQSEQLRTFEGYVSSFDHRTRNPTYVLEHITKDSSSGEGNRDNVAFYEDDAVDLRFRNRLEDFRNSGYDRGHLAPAADHKSSQAAMRNTFSLSNISPQVGKGFNRDYWARFERFVKMLTRTCEDVYIMTGPLYLPKRTASGSFEMQYPLIGEAPRLVSVPTHFYKVVLAENKSKGGLMPSQQNADHIVGAFVLPNQPIDPTTPLTAFAVPLTALEQASGLDFFPGYLTAGRRAALDTTALSWQALGRAQMQSSAALRSELQSLLAADPSLESAGQPSSTALAERPVSSTASAVSESSSAKGQKRQKMAVAPVAPRPLPTGAGGMGAIHVCEHVDCKLPAEDWFQAAKAQAVQGSSKGREGVSNLSAGLDRHDFE